MVQRAAAHDRRPGEGDIFEHRTPGDSVCCLLYPPLVCALGAAAESNVTAAGRSPAVLHQAKRRRTAARRSFEPLRRLCSRPAVGMAVTRRRQGKGRYEPVTQRAGEDLPNPIQHDSGQQSRSAWNGRGRNEPTDAQLTRAGAGHGAARRRRRQ